MTDMPNELLPTAQDWWGSRRLRYNAALAFAGIVAFLCYAAVLHWIAATVRGPNGEMPDVEATEINGAFTFLQACGYLVMMGVANLCYGLGSRLEMWLRPRNVAVWRRTMFRLGLAFSVALPFLIPVLLILQAVRHPENFCAAAP